MKAVVQWVLRTMMKDQTGVMRTLPKKDLVDLNVGITAERLMRNGIDPNSLKNADQVENAINQIEAPRNVQQGIRNTESAKVFNIEGKELDPKKPIMGGTQTGKELSKKRSDRLRGTETDRIKQRIADKKVETEAEILKRLNEDNKKTVLKIKQTQKMINDAIENVSPGFSNDLKVDADLVAEDLATRMGKVYDDLPTKERLDLYDKSYRALSKKRFDQKQMQRESLEDFVDDAGGVNPDDPRGIDDFIPDPEDMAQGGRAGFFMGGPNPKGLGLLRQVLNYMSKKGVKEDRFKGVDLSGLDMLRLSNPKAFNKLLEDVRGKVNLKEGIMGTDTVRAQQEALRAQRKGLTEKTLDVAKEMKADDDKIKIRLAKEAETTIIPKTKKMMMEDMGMSEEAAEKAARDMVEVAQNIKLIDSPPKITEEGILQLENVLKNLETGGKKKRDLNAEGGRIGFKDGPKKSMTRRSFLKILGGLAAIPIVGKFLKPIKTAKGIKSVPIIKTGDVPGKPEWFDALVNKVILEGDDVTKRFATQERQVIHMKKIDDETTVTVTQDLNDGSIMVDVDDPIRNVMGESGQDTSVQMMLKKGQADETTKGTPADEFSFTENDMRNYMDGPDDYTTEFVENTVDKMSDLTSDLGKIKQYATGKGPTMKQIVESKKRKDMVKFAEENPSEYAANRGPEFDPDYDDYASGGIARMLGE